MYQSHFLFSTKFLILPPEAVVILYWFWASLSYSTIISLFETLDITVGTLIGGYTFNTHFIVSILLLSILQLVPPFSGSVENNSLNLYYII